MSRDPGAAAEMIRRSGQHGVPVLVVGDQVIVGFDRPRLEQALARMAARRVRLGAHVAASRSLAGGEQFPPGAYVGRVALGSPAEAAGLRAGDVIIRLAGIPIRGPKDIEEVLSRVVPGQTVEVLWIRQGQEMRGRLQF